MAVSELQATPPELALPLADLGLLLAQLEDEDAELALQHVDLALRQPPLPPPQQLLLRPLLQGGARQLLLPGPQLLRQRDTRQRPARPGPSCTRPPVAWDPGAALPAAQTATAGTLSPAGPRPEPGHRPRLALSALWSSEASHTLHSTLTRPSRCLLPLRSPDTRSEHEHSEEDTQM